LNFSDIRENIQGGHNKQFSEQFSMPDGDMRLAAYHNRLNSDFKTQLLLRNPGNNRGKNHFRSNKSSMAGKPPVNNDPQFRL